MTIESFLSTQASSRKDVSIVVPVFNSERTLFELSKRVHSYFEKKQLSYELILVDDSGGGASWTAIKLLSVESPNVLGLRLSRNYGQHNALLAGIRAATGLVIVTLDDDLQNPPEEIGQLIEALNAGYDVVYGIPIDQKHSFLRFIASRMTKMALSSIMGAEVARNVSSFRVFKCDLRESFAHYESPSVIIDVLLTWGTSNFGFCPVRHEERRFGQSGYSIGRLIRHAFDLMTGFSVLPLKIASLMGLSFSLFGFFVLVYILTRYILEGSIVPGFPFLASLISIFAGAQLLAIGILGEYIARMFERSMNKPPYCVVEQVQASKN